VSWISIALIAVVVFLVAAGAGSALRAANDRRRQYERAIGLWQETVADQRMAAFSALPLETDLDAPGWYLLGCAHLRRYETKLAARAFGMAHHADCNLDSAALLTFACLKAAEGPDSDIVEQMVITWQEMKRPQLPRHAQDDLLLECLSADTPVPPELQPLGRLAWLVIGPALQPRVRQLLSREAAM
jgi:hypothetical protein